MTYRLPLTSYHPNTAKIMMKVNDSALKKRHTPCSDSIYFVVQLQEERLPAGQYTSNVHSVLFNSAVNCSEYIVSMMDE